MGFGLVSEQVPSEALILASERFQEVIRGGVPDRAISDPLADYKLFKRFFWKKV